MRSKFFSHVYSPNLSKLRTERSLSLLVINETRDVSILLIRHREHLFKIFWLFPERILKVLFRAKHLNVCIFKGGGFDVDKALFFKLIFNILKQTSNFILMFMWDTENHFSRRFVRNKLCLLNFMSTTLNHLINLWLEGFEFLCVD